MKKDFYHAVRLSKVIDWYIAQSVDIDKNWKVLSIDPVKDYLVLWRCEESNQSEKLNGGV